MSDVQVHDGVVEISLQGKKHTLVPTLEACIEISRQNGGINGAIQRITALDFETICKIIGSGLMIDGKRLNPRQIDDMVPQAVFETGVIAVAASCLKFCRIVANGGREIEDDQDDHQEGDQGPLE